MIVDEPPPPAGDPDYVDGEELPDPDGEPEEEGDDWYDPDDETPLLEVGT